MVLSYRRRKRIDLQHHDIPGKANRILHFILVAIFLVLVRVWHLSVIQYDQKLEESQKPQLKTVIEPAIRATIRDRYNIPLAINKMAYQATILYSQIRDIPSFTWQKDATGMRKKVYRRREHIHQLAKILGTELQMDDERIEDLIHAKASFYSQIPFVIKNDLTEREYYKLKAMEKDWPGLYVRRQPRRYYPEGRVAADIIGYLGSINRLEYEKILHEKKALEEFIRERENQEEMSPSFDIEDIRQARWRLKDLEAKAYTIHDYVGKTGVEAVFEEKLRGFYGKKIYYADSKGNFLRELPGSRSPLSGHRILLSISSELQEYAERLLAENEPIRIVRKCGLGAVKKTVMALKEPWIKGGSIVVLEPSTGEILTLASYPRYDPNDFILMGDKEEQKQQKMNIHRWLESEAYLALLWNQQLPLERERYDAKGKKFYDEKRMLSWKAYLDFILPEDGQLRRAAERIATIEQAAHLQRNVESIRSLFPQYDLYTLFNAVFIGDEHESHRYTLSHAEKSKLGETLRTKQADLEKIKMQLNAYFIDLPHNYDKVLIVDLSRLFIAHERFSEELLTLKGLETLENYHHQTGSFVTLEALLKEVAKNLYHEIDYKRWRQAEEKTFLKAKRIEEKLAKTYPKPYLDYLDQKEKVFFKEFWSLYCWDCLYTFLTGKVADNTSSEGAIFDLTPYLTHFQEWHEKIEQGADKEIEWKGAYSSLKNAIKELPGELSIEYLKTIRPYEQLNRPLLGKYRLRPEKIHLEKHLASAFYPSYGFGYGRSHAYRQACIQGSLFKLVTAYEALVQRFRKMGNRVVSFQELNPLVMVDDAYQHGNVQYVGYTEDGKPLPQLYKGGRLPRSLAHKHSGRLDLLKAFEVSSNPYFALLAGEYLESPDDLSNAARLFSFGAKTGIDLPGEIAGKIPEDLATNRTGLYAMAIGQHSLVVTPLQTGLMLATIANGGKVIKPKLVKLTAGCDPGRGDDQLICLPSFPYQKALSLIGIDFPLFSSLSYVDRQNLVSSFPTEVKREIFMPEVIRQILLRGLQRCTQKSYQESLGSLTKLYRQHPEAIRQFKELKNDLLGKTSTSESVENIDLDLKEGTNIYTHVWFGSIAFEEKNKISLLLKDEFGNPELIVVVYLRYGGYGKEAAPLAAQIVKKWRKIKQKHAN